MKYFKIKKNNIKKVILISIFVLIIGIIFTIISLIPKNNVYCTISKEILGTGNIKVKLIVNAYGMNAKIENNLNELTDSSYYETIVNENGTYIFKSVSGNKKADCKVSIDNLINEEDSIYLSASTEDIASSLVLKIIVPDDYELPDKPYSFDGELFTNDNSLLVLKNGIYEVYVKDKLGNVNSVSYNVTNINEIIPLTMEMGTTKILLNTNNVKYTSNNPNVALVNDNGLVTAKNIGEAIITAILPNNDVMTWDTSVIKPHVTNITLSDDNIILKPNEERLITIKIISPSNTICEKISYKSSNNSVVTVTSGVIKGISMGESIITATCDDVSSDVLVTVKEIMDPVSISSSYQKYESNTLKYYVLKEKDYYLTYIWMIDPYNQIKKLDSNTATYGKILTDNELSSKTFTNQTVGDMVNKYTEFNIIPSSKAVIAFNASAYYNTSKARLSDNWFVLNEGVVTRNINEDNNYSTLIIGIDENSNLKIYGNSKTAEGRKEIANKILLDKVKNTFTFIPKLIENGVKVKGLSTDSRRRQAICQINTNNYVMLTSIYGMSIAKTADVLYGIGCQTAFNLDGGTSTEMFYKNPYENESVKVTCSGVCRKIVEGIYFIEK